MKYLRDKNKILNLIKHEPQISQNNLDGVNKKVRRNDLCPCGSGKKFKKCCISFQ
jgi:uncharacterized protein YecA (UPF0149 family)